MRRTLGKLWLLSTLYFSQGLPFGFFSQALPALMRQRGYSLEHIGLSSLLAAPWAFKFLWAPLVDRTGAGKPGRRKAWILPLQALAALTLVALAFLEPEGPGLGVLMAAVVVTNVLAATQDVPTDALAVAMLSERERGAGNGVQLAGYRVGMIVGGSAMLVLFDRLGWRSTFLLMGALVALATVPVLLFREPAGEVPKARPTLAAVATFFRRDGAGAWVLLLVVWKAGESLGTGVLRAFLVDHGATLTDIGELLGTVGFTAGLAGALGGGALVGRLGRGTALWLFGTAQALTMLLWWYVAAHGAYLSLVVTCVVEHLASGAATAVLFTWMMDACRPGLEGTDYTVQASAVVVAQGGAYALSGLSAARLGYELHFGLGFALCVGAVALAFTVRRSLERFRQGPVAT